MLFYYNTQISKMLGFSNIVEFNKINRYITMLFISISILLLLILFKRLRKMSQNLKFETVTLLYIINFI